MKKNENKPFRISYEAMDRMCEEFLNTHPSYASRAAGMPTLKAGRSMTDRQLLAKLRSFGVEIDRESFAQQVRREPSAEALSEALIGEAGVDLPNDKEADWLWISTAVLWERWFPDEPCFELLSKRIAEGYTLRENDDFIAAATVWLRAWRDVVALVRKVNTHKMSTFDYEFGGYQSVFNWCQEVPDVLVQAGRTDPSFFRELISYGESLLVTFRNLSPLIAQNTRRSIAEACFKLGDTDRGDQLFRTWLADDPQWGWGWIGWSDCYAWPLYGIEDLHKAEQVLREGLAVSGLRDRKYLTERLQDLCSQAGSKSAAKTSVAPAPMDLGGDRMPKTGRNQPCPCGSGKKYKKCCGQ